jgi:CBS domain containing-hemolysin-like protein
MPIFGSWEDPNTIGEALWNTNNMVLVLIFGIFVLCYIELAHASIRFSQIDNYATSHNIRDFSVNSVINNYFIWFAILMAIIFCISLGVLLLQIGMSGYIKDVAPQFGYSLEYNSVISILISIALVFVPIGIIITFVFGYFVKSRREIVVKSKDDIVARAPDAVEIK